MSEDVLTKRKQLLDELSKIEAELEQDRAVYEKKLAGVDESLAQLQKKIDAATAPFKPEYEKLTAARKEIMDMLGSLGGRRGLRKGRPRAEGEAAGAPKATGTSGRARAIQDFLRLHGAASRSEIYGEVGESGWTGMELAALIRNGTVQQQDDGKYRLSAA